MFESAELGHAVGTKIYEREVPKLREALLAAQAEVLRVATFPVIVLVGGVEASGKGDTLRILSEWLDPRHVETTAFDAEDEVSSARPRMWRYWQALPPAGKVGVFFRAWYKEPIDARVHDRMGRAEFGQRLGGIARFERMLAEEGALVVKFWLHLSRKAQGKKLYELAGHRSTRWQVRPSDWDNHERYAAIRRTSEEALRRTSTQLCPWVVVEGTDARYRRLTIGRVLLDAMRARLGAPAAGAPVAAPFIEALDNRKLLRELQQEAPVEDDDYDRRLAHAQSYIATRSRRLDKAGRSLVLAFEGPDAAGKGGVIRRLTYALDPRYYRVTSIAAPSEEERRHPYLWRFWRHVPRRGRTAVFDRSWYGRVLVERVEGFSPEPVWMRAYGEINDFEAELDEGGAVVHKFWLHVTKDEQLRRFKAREHEGYKRFKLTREDWRNRKKWDDYEQAACDMFDRTSTARAPWTVVPANDKHKARVIVLETIARRLRDEL